MEAISPSQKKTKMADGNESEEKLKQFLRFTQLDGCEQILKEKVDIHRFEDISPSKYPKEELLKSNIGCPATKRLIKAYKSFKRNPREPEPSVFQSLDEFLGKEDVSLPSIKEDLATKLHITRVEHFKYATVDDLVVATGDTDSATRLLAAYVEEKRKRKSTETKVKHLKPSPSFLQLLCLRAKLPEISRQKATTPKMSGKCSPTNSRVDQEIKDPPSTTDQGRSHPPERDSSGQKTTIPKTSTEFPPANSSVYPGIAHPPREMDAPLEPKKCNENLYAHKKGSPEQSRTAATGDHLGQTHKDLQPGSTTTTDTPLDLDSKDHPSTPIVREVGAPSVESRPTSVLPTTVEPSAPPLDLFIGDEKLEGDFDKPSLDSKWHYVSMVESGRGMVVEEIIEDISEIKSSEEQLDITEASNFFAYRNWKDAYDSIQITDEHIVQVLEKCKINADVCEAREALEFVVKFQNIKLSYIDPAPPKLFLSEITAWHIDRAAELILIRRVAATTHCPPEVCHYALSNADWDCDIACDNLT